MCVSPRRGGHFCSFWSSRLGKVITPQSAPLANNNKNNNGSRRGNLLISSIRSILYAPISIMTVSREAVCIFWPRGASQNNNILHFVWPGTDKLHFRISFPRRHAHPKRICCYLQYSLHLRVSHWLSQTFSQTWLQASPPTLPKRVPGQPRPQKANFDR